LIDQLKNNVWENQNINASLTYTEPFSKYLTGTVGYTLGRVTSYTLNQSFNKNAQTGQYDIQDESLLNDFDNTSLRNGANLGLNFKKNSITVNLSNGITFESLDRTYNNLNQKLNRDQVSITPAVSMNYQITKSKSVYFRYSGRTTQPNLDQLQPL